jgi:SAM-dependent methyltransferase
MKQAAAAYEGYADFKNWLDGNDAARPEDFTALLRLTGQGLPDRLLDFGFGQGVFLDWCKQQGISTAGVEIIPEMVERALAKGHEVIDMATYQGAFQVITAIDVLEHLSVEQQEDLFRQAARLLAPGGCLVARFPNGASPFFGTYQHSDLTHVRALTATAVRQSARRCGLELALAANPRSTPPGLLGSIKRRLVYACRDLVEIFIGYIYFGRRMPMDPNVAVVLRAAPRGPSA